MVPQRITAQAKSLGFSSFVGSLWNLVYSTQMTPEQFCYWLRGVFEVGAPKTLDEQQTKAIGDHLALVFEKRTPELQHDPRDPAVMPGVLSGWPADDLPMKPC